MLLRKQKEFLTKNGDFYHFSIDLAIDEVRSGGRMKVNFKNMLTGYTGKADGMIYYRNRLTGKIYARREFTFKNHTGQPQFASAQKAIYALNPSEAYRKNLYDYILSYNALPQNAEKPAVAWTNIYNKLMFAMQKAMPEVVSLASLTREQIYEQNLPCISLRAAIEFGLLPAVESFERFDKQI